MTHDIFTTILIQPIFNLLVWLYTIVPVKDMGLAIVLLTLIVKLILHPLTAAQLRHQRALQALQPKMEEIRTRLKDNKEEQSKELMALYKTEKVNPASSCLPLLLQLPVLIALYRALSIGLAGQDWSLLYPFISSPGAVNQQFLGFLDLAKPSYVLAIAAAIIQFLQAKFLMGTTTPAPTVNADGKPEENMASMMSKQMLYLMPAMTAIIGFSLPGGLTLYWFIMSVLTAFQQWWALRKHKNAMPPAPPTLSAETPTATILPS
jgi:YidC/Oxa1 family membrane protein insertase